MIDIKSDDIAIGIQIDVEAFDDLAGLRSRCAVQFDVEAVGFWVIVQLRGASLRKLRSKKAL